ncbi:MAG: WD40/YVTN/BNR-like repeat-containing protein [Conexibacter sp.]
MSIKTALGAALAAALLALGTPAAGANVQVGSSGWQWGNPLPQGNTVRATSFAGATGYAAGDFGTLLKTTDGGSTWSGLPVGTFQGLSVVQALDANTVFAGGGCVARRSTDGGATFTSVRFTPVERGCKVPLSDLSFVSRDVGYLLLDDGSVFTTTDGGTQFAPRTAVPETRAARGGAQPGGIAFVDQSKGYAASGTKLFQTLDGGVSWRVVGEPGRTIHAIWFADATHGFVVGDAGLLLSSDDGGGSWTARDLGAGALGYTSIRCADTQLCVLTTRSGTQLVRTTDAGRTAGTVVTAATDPIYAAAFASPTRVAAAGEHGTTVVSDDAGVRFAPIGGRIDGTFSALRVGGAPNTAFAPGADGRLAKTTDGGRTWSTGNVPTTADLLDVSFPSAAVGYALDTDGGLFRTENAGSTWKTLGTGSTRRPRAVLAPDASSVLVVGPRGVRRSVDAGETFDLVRARAVLRAQLSDVDTARTGGAIVAWGPAALVRSTNEGGAWTSLPLPGRGVRVAKAAFASARVGLLLDTFGRVWRTTNGGGRWSRLTSVGTAAVNGLAVSSARTATLVIGGLGEQAGGYLLRSDDAGATWQPQFVVNEQIGARGLAAGDGVDYLLAGDAGLLFSTTGGVAGDASELTLRTKHRRLTRAGRITVTGQLQPAAGGAQVIVSMVGPTGRGFSHQTVPVASNGTFVTAWRVPRGTTTFVAQWTGDFKSAGAGSRPMTVTVAPKARRAHRRRHR